MTQKQRPSLLLHPDRVQILVALLNKRNLSAKQLALLLPTIPQTTLYRHLDKLLKADILKVVEERQRRALVERIYGLNEEALKLSSEELDQLPASEVSGYFSSYVLNLLDEGQRFLQSEEAKVKEFTFQKNAAYLSYDEYAQFRSGMEELLINMSRNEPKPDRTRRIITLIIIPELPTQMSDIEPSLSSDPETEL